MPRQTYDPGSKWMLEKRGAALLWLAGLRGVVSCKALQPEVVQPRKLPDGLLEATVSGRKKPLLVLVEVATYPEKRVVKQVCGDLRLVRQTRGALPEAIVLCLSQKGTYRVPSSAEERSPLGLTGESLSWKVVELWTIPAEQMTGSAGRGRGAVGGAGEFRRPAGGASPTMP